MDGVPPAPELFAIENRSPAEGAFSQGFEQARPRPTFPGRPPPTLPPGQQIDATPAQAFPPTNLQF